MPACEWGWQITPEELRSWILSEDPELLVVNKPALVVCHPSKHGPWSSLIGACREYLGAETLHLPSRLDRETSGVVVIARNRDVASRLQRAATKRRVRKTYWAILTGVLPEIRIVAFPLDRDLTAEYAGTQQLSDTGRSAETEFIPVASGGGYTLARVRPKTGRLHQIRVHASAIGHAVAGDKLYGPDRDLMMEFVKKGFTDRLAALLPLRRHALHAGEIVFQTKLGEETFRAPLAADLIWFCRETMGIEPPPDSLYG